MPAINWTDSRVIAPPSPAQRRRIVFEECSREESRHLLLGATADTPLAVYVYTGRYIAEWLENHCNDEGEFTRNGYYFVRQVGERDD